MFKTEILEDSQIHLYTAKSEILLSVKGSEPIKKIDIDRFEHLLSGTDLTRENIVVNQKDILVENNNGQNNFYKTVPNAVVEEKLDKTDFHIVENSIKIVKLLSTNEYSQNSINNYGIDAETLNATIESNTQIGSNKNLWGRQTGLNIKEFESYSKTNNIINYDFDDFGNIIGFKINLGTLNEAKGVNGEYIIITSDNENKSVPKDNQPFGYLIYYNAEKNSDSVNKIESGKGSFRITVRDLDTKELVAGCEFSLYNSDGIKVSSENTNLITNQYGIATSENFPLVRIF